MLKSFLLVAAVALARGAEVAVLDEASFESTVYGAGKSVFVKFYAPWCGHCKSMKPAWDQLGAAVNGGADPVVIADVDCTVEKTLCAKYGVKGYPTVKYYQEDEGTDYKGGRDFPTLDKFVKETLAKPICNSANKAACSADDLVEIEKWEKVTPAERKAEVERIEEEVKKIEKTHEALLESLQKQYESSKEETEKFVSDLNKPLRYLKKVKDVAAEMKDEM
ncbi:thioredoxin-like protein [Pavlovales sp. CCMP2436]|nr:thioredoxin-like protein [Pavlovales sp. CCMP2436]